MNKILIVEDSQMVLKIIKNVFSHEQSLDLHYAESFAQARGLLEAQTDWFAALVGLNLPDAPHGELVDFVLEKDIPTIVLTGTIDEEKREMLLAKGIVDYVTKEGKVSYEYALGVVRRLINNISTTVLIADSTDISRGFTADLLKRHLFTVLEASNGVQALKILLENPQIKMLITDCDMPRMDGFELVKNIRTKFEKTDLIVIGLSSDTKGVTSAKFIKNGANDFLRKPFNHEEFFCRISHNIEFIELIQSIRDGANRDELTGVFTQKYFEKLMVKKYEEAERNNAELSLGIISIDNFEEIEPAHGDGAGEWILKYLAQRLTQLFDHFILARAGLDFIVGLPGLNSDQGCAFIERIRQIICAEKIEWENGNTISITFAGGASSIRGESLDDLMANALLCLKRAQDAGGDLVFGDDNDP